MRRLLCVLIFVWPQYAVEVNPGYSGEERTPPQESPLRRGEIVFFISYPFTFAGSLLGYNLAAAAIETLDKGRSTFSPSGAGFFGLVAATAAFLSFGIALDDYYAVQAAMRNDAGGSFSYLEFRYRF
ncbi:MAG: hypothetical protein N2Z22_09720 [Turneriella sp.]|nr:hypothetical protein [Turneriella sp.]